MYSSGSHERHDLEQGETCLIRIFATTADLKRKEPMIRSLEMSISKGAEECPEMLKS